MTTMLQMTPDELLTTTRSVRRRLDFDRPVDPEVVVECLRIAQQAPTATNTQKWHFVVVTDPEKRKGLAEVYRKGAALYPTLEGQTRNLERTTPDEEAQAKRLWDSAIYLYENMERAPVHVVACVEGRCENRDAFWQSVSWGTIVTATWSFNLALRARGLGTTMTTLHLLYEREAAALLGIPYDDVLQTALLPVAYTKGTDFRPGPRKPLETMLHWERW